MDKISTIKENILYFIEKQNISKVNFYELTGITASNFKGSGLKSEIGGDKIVKILSCYPQLNPDWLLTGEGSMLKSKSLKKPHTIDIDKQVIGIPMLPFDAFAGIGDSSITGVNFDTIEERYVVPLFDGIKIDFMIPVRGSSMYPKYSSGDVVACRLIDELLFIQWNKVYVIDSNSQGVIMKRLLKGDDNDHIICRSDNKDYDDFNVPMTDIRSIAIIVGVIRLE